MDENIAQFINITGATTEDAEKYLSISDGNLENAVGLFLEGGLDVNRQTEAQIPEDFADEIRAPIVAQHGTLIDGGYDGQDDDELSARQQMMMQWSFRPEPIVNPFATLSDSATPEANRLAQMFAPPVEIMYRRSFDEARVNAQAENRWILVTLHDASEFGCQILNRDLWKAEQIVELIKERFLFLQFGHISPDGMRYKNFYPVHELPHIALIDPTTGERVKLWTGVQESDEFYGELQEFLISFKQPKGTKRLLDMSEEEQMAAILAQSAEEVPQMKKVALIAKFRDPLQSEEVGTTIQFRLPDGSRVKQQFAKSDNVLVLFQHAMAILKTDKELELFNHREPLSVKIHETIEEANVAGVSLQVDYK